MFWLLLALILLVCVLALAATLLTLWRRVKVLGRAATQLGEATAQLDALTSGTRAAPDCPTCGAPASAAAKKRPTSPVDPAVRRPAA